MKTDEPTHVVFAGGGTAGHLFPGLAVARRLAAEWARWRITFAGSGRQFERTHVAAAGFAHLALRCRPLPRRPWHLPGFVADNLAGYLAARRFLRQQEVDVVVGLGGTLRLGLNPGEFVDFILGFVGIDFMRDDFWMWQVKQARERDAVLREREEAQKASNK